MSMVIYDLKVFCFSHHFIISFLWRPNLQSPVPLAPNTYRMLFETRRSATIRTLCFCETLFLRRESYTCVAAHFPKYAKKVRKRAIKVMWRNMLTSHTLKQALINAAHMREMQLRVKKQRPSSMDLAESMQELMGDMTERLRQYEELGSSHKSTGADGIESLQRENRRLRRRLTEEGIITD